MRLSLFALLSLSLCCSPLRAQEEIETAPETAVGAAEAEQETDAPAEEETDEGTEPDEETDDSDDTAAETLVATLKERFAALAELLEGVQDEESARTLLPEVRRQFADLLSMDVAALGEEDEEELAAEFAEAFSPIDSQLLRLEENAFFGVDELREVFVPSEEDAEDERYIFPLGPLDFLRGNKEEERHVCPRHEGGLQLLDWSEE